MVKRKITTIGEDLIELVKNNSESGRYCFRKEELENLYTLTVNNKNHVLLKGNPGSGKDYLVESLARKVYESNNPYIIKILRVRPSSLIVGTSERGSLEKRFEDLIALKESAKLLIIVLPEMHHLTRAGATADNPFGSILNLLPDFLNDPRLVFIGHTTPEGYNLLITQSDWIQYKFVVICLKTMSDEDTINSVKTYMQQRGDLPQIANDVFFYYLIQMARRIIPNLDRPGNAVTLLHKAVPLLTSEKEDEISSDLSIEILNQVISKTTGLIPVLFNHNPIQKQEILNMLKDQYKGYEEHLARMIDFFLRFKAHLAPVNRPAASVLMLGPTGVGKTELVRQVTQYMYGGNLDKLRIYDTTEYATEDAIKSFIGDPSNPFSPGRLIKDITNDPFSVFLFDEIEKAHPTIRNLFLQILGDGRLSDPFGNTYSFVNAFIFMTSNIGFEQDSPFYKKGEINKEQLLERLYQKFPRELLNRIEEIFIFDFLDKKTVKEIAEKELRNTFSKKSKWARAFCLSKNIEIKWDEEVISYLAQKGYKKEFGAREIQRIIEREIIFPLASKVCESPNCVSFWIKVSDGKIRIL